jgi:hypothetical protein
MKYNSLSVLNKRNLFLTVLEAGSLRFGCQHGRFLMRAFFLTYRWLLSQCTHMTEKKQRDRERERERERERD